MERLLEKIENLKIELDKTDSIKKIKELNKKIKKDEELQRLLKTYENTSDKEIKEEIINNDLFNEYKEVETNVNILILEINQKLKKISKKGNCKL